MNSAKFEEIWTSQVAAEKAVLLERAEAYSTHFDRLGNFYEGAKVCNTKPMRYAFGLVTKHIVALRDLIDKISDGNGSYAESEAEKFGEYVTDIRNYSVLLKALYLNECSQRHSQRKAEVSKTDEH